jgi:hypothetical protein
VDWDRTPYHIHVYDVKNMHERSNFLVPFDKILCSSSYVHVHDGMLNSWSQPNSIDPHARNMVANPDVEDEMETGHIFFNPIAEGVQDGVPLEQVMYIAPSFVNGAEFPRWINRNWESLASDLSKKAQYNAYMIQLPERGGKEKDFDFIILFIFDEFEELHRRTLEANEDPRARTRASLDRSCASTRCTPEATRTDPCSRSSTRMCSIRCSR